MAQIGYRTSLVLLDYGFQTFSYPWFGKTRQLQLVYDSDTRELPKVAVCTGGCHVWWISIGNSAT